MSSFTKAGKAALDAKDYPLAISNFSKALSEFPTSPDIYVLRSTARQRDSDLPGALNDAEIATELAFRRQKREAICNAQLRRTIVLSAMRKWPDASKTADWALRGASQPLQNQISIHKSRIDRELAKAGDDPTGQSESTVEERPQVTIPDATIEAVTVRDEEVDKERKGSVDAAGAASALSQTTSSQSSVAKPRHEWYQSKTLVTIDLLSKNVPKDKATVEITPSSVKIHIPGTSSSTDFQLVLDPLYAAVDSSKSTYSFRQTKIEVTLQKQEPGLKWQSLEGVPNKSADVASPSLSSTDTVQKVTLIAPHETPPSYPTSSRKGAKDWDKVAQEGIKQFAKKPARPASAQKPHGAEPGESEADADADADDDDEDKRSKADDYDSDDGDPTNAFFKKLYRNADPDTRRAMMKSYSESMGTSLSTNWKDVGKGPVAVQPPSGMEAKKYVG